MKTLDKRLSVAPMMDWTDSGRIGATRHGPSHDCHRPTWPADPATHATDRVVLRDGARVGRVMRIEHGPQGWRWQRSGLWIWTDNRGVVASLAEELEAAWEGCPG